MADPYTPALDSLVLTDDEKKAVATALATSKPWEWSSGDTETNTISKIKQKVRDLHMARHGSRCCYCRDNLYGRGPFVIDREHVLPKSRAAFKMFTFEVWNLGIACKRCNMQYKRNRIDFVVDPKNISALQLSSNYYIIHPNYDCYRDHIRIVSFQDDDITIVNYTTLGSNKGNYTYEYFNLRELEVASFDAAQGLHKVEGLGPVALAAKSLATNNKKI